MADTGRAAASGVAEGPYQECSREAEVGVDLEGRAVVPVHAEQIGSKVALDRVLSMC